MAQQPYHLLEKRMDQYGQLDRLTWEMVTSTQRDAKEYVPGDDESGNEMISSLPRAPPN